MSKVAIRYGASGRDAWETHRKSGILIESGSFTLTVSANSYEEESVEFNTQFSSAPIVMLTLKSTTTTTEAVANSNIMLSDDPTTTGFSCRLFNGYSQSITRVVYWSAIGH